MSRNDDSAQKIYQIICIIKNIVKPFVQTFSQTNARIPEQINFVEKSEEDDGASFFYH